MIISQIQQLIYELKHYSTLERLFRYGIINTLSLSIQRLFDIRVYNYFKPFLSKLDRALQYANTTPYKIDIDRIYIGELYNITKTASHSEAISDDLNFFENYFKTLNQILFELIRASIDEMKDNGINVSNINSTIRFKNAQFDSNLFNNANSLIDSYYDLLQNKPTSFMNVISSLKRFNLDSTFINNIMSDLDSKVRLYTVRNSIK